MDQYIVFRNNKRVCLREEDMTGEKLSRIFQVSIRSLYLTDDTNVVCFLEHLVFSAHWTLIQELIMRFMVRQETSASSNTMSPRFSFMRGPAGAVSSTLQQTAHAPPRATVSKIFQRSVLLAEVAGGRLSPSRMVVVRFLECEATLQGIIGKVQDAVGSHDPIVLTDAHGNAILESEGTTGSTYWKQNARKILAVKEQDYEEMQDKKRRKSSGKYDDVAGIGDVTEKVEELVLAAQSLPDVTVAIRELTNLATSQKVILTPSQLLVIKQGFCCVVCMRFIEEPVFTDCCRSIIGCKTCVMQWQMTSEHCAKCRGRTTGTFEVNGLTEVLSVLRPFFEEE
ncbi:uncharacterized protein LOC114450189 [Parambassis ranga]|uniref:Uncharacterized protein LOC114450189 n=1 Tax=Parambassis ranga TaxID=210632 RepID=A0A6P7K3U8_9TELE|nr:uncharacterized protein LOC114450189 [Parambassis ranga]